MASGLVTLSLSCGAMNYEILRYPPDELWRAAQPMMELDPTLSDRHLPNMCSWLQCQMQASEADIAGARSRGLGKVPAMLEHQSTDGFGYIPSQPVSGEKRRVARGSSKANSAMQLRLTTLLQQ